MFEVGGKRVGVLGEVGGDVGERFGVSVEETECFGDSDGDVWVVGDELECFVECVEGALMVAELTVGLGQVAEHFWVVGVPVVESVEFGESVNGIPGGEQDAGVFEVGGKRVGIGRI